MWNNAISFQSAATAVAANDPLSLMAAWAQQCTGLVNNGLSVKNCQFMSYNNLELSGFISVISVQFIFCIFHYLVCMMTVGFEITFISHKYV